MPDRIGATIHEPFEITFLRIPVSTAYSTGVAQEVPGYTDAIANIRAITTEACQAFVWVSSPQDPVPRSAIAKILMGNMVLDAGFLFNPIPPDPNLYSQIPKVEGLFQR